MALFDLAVKGAHPPTRGVNARIEWHPIEPFPRVGFIVTKLLPRPPDEVVRFQNRHYAAEPRILGTLLRNALPYNEQGGQMNDQLDTADQTAVSQTVDSVL